uniref:Putative secreted protein n=1 Tax=Ixodes ricinus TaxID=34613 RepID=A0A6B0U0L4_IXORI
MNKKGSSIISFFLWLVHCFMLFHTCVFTVAPRGLSQDGWQHFWKLVAFVYAKTGAEEAMVTKGRGMSTRAFLKYTLW